MGANIENKKIPKLTNNLLVVFVTVFLTFILTYFFSYSTAQSRVLDPIRISEIYNLSVKNIIIIFIEFFIIMLVTNYIVNYKHKKLFMYKILIEECIEMLKAENKKLEDK